jgi:hypothetical protein
MAKKQVKRASKTVKKSVVRSHVAASLLSVAPHAHTGKRIQTRHTSHGFLLLALLFTGVLLFSNLGALRAFGITNHGGATISVTVNGAPPTQGAEILFPTTNELTKTPLLEVTGSCPSGTLVAIYDNTTFVGSNTCSTNDDFAITIQLFEGINTLQAQNYDAVNQPGPTTAQVAITYEPEVTPVTTPVTPLVVTKPSQLQPAPNVPAIPVVVPQPSTQPCYDLPNNHSSASTQTPVISVNCIYRNLFVGDTLRFDILIHGGQAPYALLVDWGDGKTDLKSITDSSVHSFDHGYQASGFHNLVLSTTDSQGAKSQIQTVVSVDGAPTTGGASTNPVNDIAKNIASIWIEAPVPLYVAAVTLVAGFWIGDVFQRIFLNKNPLRPTHHKRS